MKKILKLLSLLTLFLAGMYFIACEPKEEMSNKAGNFDIQYKVPQITGFTPTTANFGDTVTITGSGFSDPTFRIWASPKYASADSLKHGQYFVVSDTKLKVIVQRTPKFTFTNGKFQINSEFLSQSRLKSLSDSTLTINYANFKPVIDPTTLMDTIFQAEPYVLTGTNLDMIKKVQFGDDTLLIVTFTSQTSDTLRLGKVTFSSTSTTLQMASMTGDPVLAKLHVITKILADYPAFDHFSPCPDTVALGDTAYLLPNFTNATFADLLSGGTSDIKY